MADTGHTGSHAPQSMHASGSITAIGCPELAKLGCDHDLAGYPVILDQVDAEFRRPCTLAKGGEYCDFNFYRKGTAPPTEHLNR